MIEAGKPGNQWRINYGRWMDWGTDDGGTRRQRREQQKRIAADTALRADVQHSLVLAGDPRGIFGDYPPTPVSCLNNLLSADGAA